MHNIPITLPLPPRKTPSGSDITGSASPRSASFQGTSDLKLQLQSAFDDTQARPKISPPVKPISISAYTSDEETGARNGSRQKMDDSARNVASLRADSLGSSAFMSRTASGKDALDLPPAPKVPGQTGANRPGDIIDVHIVKQASAGLGFAISERMLDDGEAKNKVFIIQSIVPGGAASRTMEIESGDQLVSVEGKLLSGMNLKDTVEALKELPSGIINIAIRKQPKVIQGK